MTISYSRVDTFKQCPYKYKLRYLDHLETIQAPEPDDALILGKAFHEGLEKGVTAGLELYRNSFNVWSDKHENELIKLEYSIRVAQEYVNPNARFEVPIKYGEFIGYADYLEVIENGYLMLDFKYCSKSGLKRYPESQQLHLYKAYSGENISKMAYLCVPKVGIRQKQTETLYQFRERLKSELSKVEPVIIPVEFEPVKVEQFEQEAREMKEATEFTKNESVLCKWCEYKEFCQKGSKEMLLPSTERRTPGQATRRKIWLYGEPTSGKTVMLDSAPNPLNLNTDGNIEFVTMPYIAIKDEVTVEGRITKRKYAWEVLKDVIAELEKKQNDFKTIIIDLVEDTREMCRIYEYDKLGISHESDASYGKGWDIIKTEYLSTMRRFFSLDYENLVIVSHEQVNEINKKNGQKITTIKPNIQDAIANKLAGMCDIVARVVKHEDDSRTIEFKSDEYIFGGCRLRDIQETVIPLDWSELCRVYDIAQGKVTKHETKTTESEQVEQEQETEETPKRRTRKPRKAEPEPETVEEPPFEESEPVEEEKPKRRTRKRRTRTESEGQ